MGTGSKISGFILGIIGLIIVFICNISLIPAVFAIPYCVLGLVFSAVGQTKFKTGFGLASLIISIVGISVTFLNLLLIYLFLEIKPLLLVCILKFMF